MIPLGGRLQAFAAWVSTTELHRIATEYTWVWATMETLHFLGLAVLIGTIGVDVFTCDSLSFQLKGESDASGKLIGYSLPKINCSALSSKTTRAYFHITNCLACGFFHNAIDNTATVSSTKNQG